MNVARNVEIKAKVRDWDEVAARAEALSGTAGEVLEQEDVFFSVTEGRLKLRTFPDGRGELIAYDRPDCAGATTSHYRIFRTGEPENLKSVLAQGMGIRGIVRKRRILHWVDSTRIHLDDVEGLGRFLELEVVLRDGESEACGVGVADRLLEALGIAEADRIDCAYIDLLEAQEAP